MQKNKKYYSIFLTIYLVMACLPDQCISSRFLAPPGDIGIELVESPLQIFKKELGLSEPITKELLVKAVEHFGSLPDEEKNRITRRLAAAVIAKKKSRGLHNNTVKPESSGVSSLEMAKVGGVNISGMVDVTFNWQTNRDGSLELMDINLDAGGGAINTGKAVTNQGATYGLVALAGTGDICEEWRSQFANPHLVFFPAQLGKFDTKVDVVNNIDGVVLPDMSGPGETIPQKAMDDLLKELDIMLERAPDIQWITMTAGGRILCDKSPWLYNAILNVIHKHNRQAVIDFKSYSSDGEINAVLSDTKRGKPCDIIVPNIDEFISILERTGEVPEGSFERINLRESDIIKYAQILISTYRLKGVMVTMDKNGVILILEDKVIKHPALPVSVVSTTGAGDSMNAGLMLGLANGLSYEDAVAQACLFGAATVTLDGTKVATKERIDFLEKSIEASK